MEKVLPILILQLMFGYCATAQTAYITNTNSNTVSVINVVNNKVTATISVGDSPNAVEVSPDGTKVYVSNLNGRTVSIINTATNTVAATITVGNGDEQTK